MAETKKDYKQIFVGVGAVFFEDKILLVERRAPNILEYDKKFELPGGKLELGESPESAIEREVLEETGYKVECSEMLPFTYTRIIRTDDNLIHVVVVCSKCQLEDFEQKIPNEENFKWANISEIDFQDIIPGSKEFLIWILTNSNVDISKEDKIYEINLERIDTKSNKKRGYQIIINFKPQEKNRFEVLRRYGRIGTSYKTIKENFKRMEEALEHVQKIIGDRKKHNYKITDLDKNHPLRTWLFEENVPEVKSIRPNLFSK